MDLIFHFSYYDLIFNWKTTKDIEALWQEEIDEFCMIGEEGKIHRKNKIRSSSYLGEMEVSWRESVVNMVQELGFWHKHSLSLLSFLLWACPWEHSLDSIAHQHLCISQTHFKYFIAAASSSISKIYYFIASISNCNEKLLQQICTNLLQKKKSMKLLKNKNAKKICYKTLQRKFCKGE